jgi:hypothetical protein
MSLFSREPPLTPEERARRQEQVHAERMKAIELGRPLPEVELAWAKTAEFQARMETIRSNVAVIFSVLGPAAVIGITTGATSAILSLAAPSIHLTLVIVIWICAVLVALGIVAGTWGRLLRPNLEAALRRYLPRPTAPNTNATPPTLPDEGVLDPADLTPQEVERLARSIQADHQRPEQVEK